MRGGGFAERECPSDTGNRFTLSKSARDARHCAFSLLRVQLIDQEEVQLARKAKAGIVASAPVP